MLYHHRTQLHIWPLLLPTVPPRKARRVISDSCLRMNLSSHTVQKALSFAMKLLYSLSQSYSIALSSVKYVRDNVYSIVPC